MFLINVFSVFNHVFNFLNVLLVLNYLFSVFSSQPKFSKRPKQPKRPELWVSPKRLFSGIPARRGKMLGDDEGGKFWPEMRGGYHFFPNFLSAKGN